MRLLLIFALISPLALVAAQALPKPPVAPALPVIAPPKLTPLVPACPAPTRGFQEPAPPAPALPVSAPPEITPLVPARPAPLPAPPAPAPPAPPTPIKLVPSANPIVSMIQSVFRPSQSAPKPTTTYKTEPVSFALSNISFATSLVPAKPSSKPHPEEEPSNSTPGTVLFCTATTYDFWPSGDTCTLVTSSLNQCANLDDKLKKKVVAVKPDKGQLCLLYDDEDCYGKAEWVKWPGVRNLRGRIGEGGSWERRIVSFKCSDE